MRAASPRESLSPPLITRERCTPLQRLRIHDYLVMTQTMMWSRMGDRPGALGLALRACDTGGSGELADVAELLEAVQELWSEASPDRGRDGGADARPARRFGCCRSQTRSSTTCDRGGRPGSGRGPPIRRAKQLHSSTAGRCWSACSRRSSAAGPEHRVVVLGARAGTILERIDLHGAEPVVCDDWGAGQAASLHAGLAALPERPVGRSWCSETGPASTRAPSTACRPPPAGEDAIRAADYGPGRSHPVLIPRSRSARSPTAASGRCGDCRPRRSTAAT